MEKIQKILYTTASTLSIIALSFFILSTFSDRISPAFSVFFSYLGMLFPFLLILNLIIFIGWIFVKKWKIVLIYGAGLVICWGAISTYFPFHFKTKNIPSNCIKLLTYNVMQFQHGYNDTKKNPNMVLRYIAKSKADIICLQEYATFKDKYLLSEQDIKRALKDYPYFKFLSLTWPDNSQGYGLAVFSKFPILSSKEIPLSSEYNGSFILELDIHGKKTTLINNHLESNRLSIEERNEYYGLTKDFDSQKLDVVTTKITKRLTPAFKLRATQAQVISDYIKKNKNPYIIVCGDFNDTPISYARHTIKGDLEDAFAETGSGMGISYNQYRFLFRIDHIFHSKNIKAYNCTVDNSIRNSDHYPVWVYLQFN